MRHIIIKIAFLLVFTILSNVGYCQVSSSTSLSDTNTNKVFSKVDVEAEYPGGSAAWRRFLEFNVNTNIPIKKNAPIGKYTVIVRFLVSKNGKLSEVVAETNHGYGMEQEVIRAIKSGPRWIPGKQDGKKVNSIRRQPITFIVSD